jgi:hypothetical protein
VDFASGGNHDYIRQLCEWGHVIALQEAKDFTVADSLPGGWLSTQVTDSDAEAGSCLAIDTDYVRVRDHYILYGCKAPKGGGMLPRFIAVAFCEWLPTSRVFVAMSAHYPPGRYQEECGQEYTRNLSHIRDAYRQHPTLIGMDANMDIGKMAGKLNKVKGYGSGIIGWCTDQKPSDETYRGKPIDKGWSDHPAYSIKVNLPAK